ncbi:MAG: endolytic transglycosylase MltG [Patescibacteria group bacterium]
MLGKIKIEKTGKFVAVIVLAVLILGAALVLVPKKIPKVGNTEFVIARGQSLGATARELAKKNAIINKHIFILYAILTGHEKDFKAGRYILPEKASSRDLARMFSQGLLESEDVVLTVPEGVNLADIDKLFANKNLINAGDLIKASFISGNFLYEGELFPDTYRFKPATKGIKLSADEIIKKMRENFKIKTSNIFAGRFTGEGGADRGYRGIIIASILEKEVQTEEDMKLVAGIIEKRLELGMPLQIDATVAYGVCLREFLQGKYCDVSQANIVDNISIDSVYNTYSRVGLPIGPISNPGLKAMRAALNPQSSEYLFYLSARDGTTIFSKTGIEHERARQKYLK